MSLICMAVYCTETNGRYEYTKDCLESLRFTVDLSRHKLVLVDNGSYDEARNYLKWFSTKFGATLIRNEENIGTARAVNMGLRLREPGQYCIKVDNDVTWKRFGWVDEMEEALEREPGIGVLGLKRKDLCQTPYHEDPDFRSEMVQLSHEPGQRWISVEKSRDVMGTCTMINWRLIDKIGGYAQPNIYGLDDSLYNLRSILAGFWNAFLPHIDIDHIDTGANPYSQEKIALAGEAWPIYHEWHAGYVNGTRSLYEEI